MHQLFVQMPPPPHKKNNQQQTNKQKNKTSFYLKEKDLEQLCEFLSARRKRGLYQEELGRDGTLGWDTVFATCFLSTVKAGFFLDHVF